MLNIYYAPPFITIMPEDPDHLELAGSMDIDTHRSLARLIDNSGRTDISLRYFEDSILKPAQVATLLEIVMAEGHGPAFASLEAMRGVLAMAVRHGWGLVAFGD